MRQDLASVGFSLGLHLILLLAVWQIFTSAPKPTDFVQLDFDLSYDMGSAGQSSIDQAAKAAPLQPKNSTQQKPQEEAELGEKKEKPKTVAATKPTPFQDKKSKRDEVKMKESNSTNQKMAPGQAAAVRKRYLKENLNRLQRAIQNYFIYPAVAREMGLTGKVIVSFFLTMNGTIENITLYRSSGHTVLDQSALTAIQQIQSLPRPKATIRVLVPIDFSLD